MRILVQFLAKLEMQKKLLPLQIALVLVPNLILKILTKFLTNFLSGRLTLRRPNFYFRAYIQQTNELSRNT